jgi:hypothetical protein
MLRVGQLHSCLREQMANEFDQVKRVTLVVDPSLAFAPGRDGPTVDEAGVGVAEQGLQGGARLGLTALSLGGVVVSVAVGLPPIEGWGVVQVDGLALDAGVQRGDHRTIPTGQGRLVAVDDVQAPPSVDLADQLGL